MYTVLQCDSSHSQACKFDVSTKLALAASEVTLGQCCSPIWPWTQAVFTL